jgi:hypothetical protein
MAMDTIALGHQSHAPWWTPSVRPSSGSARHPGRSDGPNHSVVERVQFRDELGGGQAVEWVAAVVVHAGDASETVNIQSVL